MRAPVSLIKPVAKLNHFDILEGLPNGFLALIGIVLDEGVVTHGDFILPDMPEMWSDEFTGALGDIFDIAKNDPAAFMAMSEIPAVKEGMMMQLKDVAEQKTVAIDTKKIEQSFRQQQERIRQHRPEQSQNIKAKAQTQAFEEAVENKKDSDRESDRRGPRKTEQDTDIDIPDDLLDSPDNSDIQNRRSAPDTQEQDEIDILDLAELTLIHADHEAEEQELEAHSNDETRARAWDKLSETFGQVTGEDISVAMKRNYPSGIVKEAFTKAQQGPFQERPDNQLPLFEKIQLEKSLNLAAHTDVIESPVVNTLPV